VARRRIRDGLRLLSVWGPWSGPLGSFSSAWASSAGLPLGGGWREVVKGCQGLTLVDALGTPLFLLPSVRIRGRLASRAWISSAVVACGSGLASGRACDSLRGHSPWPLPACRGGRPSGAPAWSFLCRGVACQGLGRGRLLRDPRGVPHCCCKY
jgi:hypothetical protein